MSKKTLLDFFQTSPRVNSELKTIKSPPASVTPKNDNKRRVPISKSISPKINGNEETQEPPTKKKRRRLIIASDSEDSEDEYKPEKEIVDENDSSDSDSSYTPTSKKRKTINTPLSSFKSPTSRVSKINRASASPKQISSPSTPLRENVENNKESIDEGYKEWQHLTLDWLKDEKIKDKMGRLKSHPEYNPQTLFVPDNFKKNLTPAMKQWWEMKSNHFDTILFFKVGKFYELYHMDAVIAVTELGLTYMKGDFAHSGFPEIAYGKFSDNLVDKGYKVARVEQTETPQMMEERCRQMYRPTKFDKVVSREICQITSKGTRTFNIQDGEPMAASSNYLLAITEKNADNPESKTIYGVCFIDVSVGKFHLGQFSDDRHGSRLMTLTALFPPVEILYEKEALSKKTLQILNSTLSNVKKEPLSRGSQFWDSSKVLKFLSESKYFVDKDENIHWPEALEEMLDKDDMLNQSALKQYELALCSLGACIWYLKECCIEDNLLTMKLFEIYKPLDRDVASTVKNNFKKQHMVLDAMTLHNLEIVSNNYSSSSLEGTLLNTMDFCSTNFGKRLFRHWLCSPLCNPRSIVDRLDAIDDLMAIPDVIDMAIPRLKRIPDLERMLSKIHNQGLARSKDHPDSRAIFYEAEIYNKKKISDFLATIEGFKESLEVISLFKPHLKKIKSCILKQCISSTKDGGNFPDLSKQLNYIAESFDAEAAKKEGNIIPGHGIDSEYDSAISEIKDTQNELNDYLRKLQKKYQCKINFVGNGRTRFQLEFPEETAKKLPDNFEFQGSRKGFKRYYTNEVKELLSRYMGAEEARDAALRDINRRFFSKFDQDYNLWKTAIYCLSVLDVLISLFQYRRTCEVTMCRPEFVLPNDNIEPFLEIVEGRHPTYHKLFTGDDYIPNSIYIGPKKEEAKENSNQGGTVVLVTGPNMGGKSTLMRQTGTLVIMAHLGSYVPAESCQLTPIDRIFTRVGASDRINAGESTFFVEASETACILQHATSDSLILVDELGRGTATHDGVAIASAVLDRLANVIKCRTLFSTHYHNLVEDFLACPTVGLGHMACMVEDDNENPALENITFLYKFVNGLCPKSYGFNAASLAGISNDVVHAGFLKSKQMEIRARSMKALRQLLNTMKADEILGKIKMLSLQKNNE